MTFLRTTTVTSLLLRAPVLALLLAAATGHTATVELLPGSDSVSVGESFDIDFYMDAADAPGAHPGSFRGSIVLDFDSDLVAFASFSVADPDIFISGPIVDDSGDRTTVTLEFDNAPDVGVIGTFTLMALSEGLATFELADADPFFGSFANHLPTNQPFFPDFIGTSIDIVGVPLPGAAWLLLSAIGLVRMRRRVVC
jgi:hypothetical protein